VPKKAARLLFHLCMCVCLGEWARGCESKCVKQEGERKREKDREREREREREKEREREGVSERDR